MSSDSSMIEINNIGYLPAAHPASEATKATMSRKLPGGKAPWGVSYSSYQKRLYVASSDPGRVLVYDVRHSINYKIFRYIYRPDVVFSPPLGDDVSLNFITCSTRNKAYVSLEDDSDNTGRFALINTTMNTAAVTSRLPSLSDRMRNMAFSPDALTSYFPDGPVLYALDEQSDAPPDPIQLPNMRGYWVTVTNDGVYAYFGGGPGIDMNTPVARVDLAKRKFKDVVKYLNGLVQTFDVSFDNKKLLVSTMTDVHVVDIESNALIATLDYSLVGQVSCSKVSPYACVPVQIEGSGEAAIIDTVHNTKLGSIPVPPFPGTSAFDEYGNAYIETPDGVTVILHTKLETMGGSASSAS